MSPNKFAAESPASSSADPFSDEFDAQNENYVSETEWVPAKSSKKPLAKRNPESDKYFENTFGVHPACEDQRAFLARIVPISGLRRLVIGWASAAREHSDAKKNSKSKNGVAVPEDSDPGTTIDASGSDREAIINFASVNVHAQSAIFMLENARDREVIESRGNQENESSRSAIFMKFHDQGDVYDEDGFIPLSVSPPAEVWRIVARRLSAADGQAVAHGWDHGSWSGAWHSSTSSGSQSGIQSGLYVGGGFFKQRKHFLFCFFFRFSSLSVPHAVSGLAPGWSAETSNRLSSRRRAAYRSPDRRISTCLLPPPELAPPSQTYNQCQRVRILNF